MTTPQAFKNVMGKLGGFVTDAEGVARFNGEELPAPFMTSMGPCTSAIKSGSVS